MIHFVPIFSGVMPKESPRLIPKEQAQVASWTRLDNTELRAWQAPVMVIGPCEGGGGPDPEPEMVERTPAQMQFSVVHSINLAASGGAALMPFALQFLNEAFDADDGQFTHYAEGTAATFTVTGGQAILDNNTSGARGSVIKVGDELTMPQVWVQIDVVSHPDTATSYDNIGVGVCKDADNFVWASVDDRNNLIRIQVKNGGVITWFASVAFATSAPYSLALSLVANSAVVWVDTGSGFTVATSADISSALDFKATSLTGWAPGFSAATANSSEWVFDNLRAGRFGAVGLRDVYIVTNEDGSPYDIENDHVYLTATCPDPRGTSYMGVFELALDSTPEYQMTQTGVIMVDRGGSRQNDHAGQIVVLDNGDQMLLTSTWGNGFGGALDILVRTISGGNLLSGASVVDSMSTLSLPGDLGGSYGVYDPYIVKAGDDWLLSYVVTADTDFSPENFYIAAATSSDLVSWSSVDEDTSRTVYEGPKIAIASDQRWILGGGRTNAIIYDESMTYVGVLDYVLDSPSGDTQPHTNIFPYGDKFLLLTHTDDRYGSGGFTWGHLVIQQSDRYVET